MTLTIHSGIMRAENINHKDDVHIVFDAGCFCWNYQHDPKLYVNSNGKFKFAPILAECPDEQTAQRIADALNSTS